MKKLLIVEFSLALLSSASAQTLTSASPPCSAFGTISGTCLQGGGAAGTPSSITLTNGTGLSISTGLLGAGTGVLTALGVNIGSAGAPVTNGGALGTPSSGVGTNITGVNAATLGGATFAAPGAIGGGTPGTGAFTTLNASGKVTVGNGATGALYVTGQVGTGTANAALMDTTGAGGFARLLATGPDASTKGNWQFDVISSDFSSNLVAMGISATGAITMPALASSSAAQTGTVCWSTGTGNLTVDTTTTCLLSAGKYKHDIRPLNEDSLSKVMALRPVSYAYNTDLAIAGEQIGLIAEDVAAIDDRLVSHDPVDGSVRAVRYQQLTAVLAGAIKELKADNDDLRSCQLTWKCRIFGVK